MATLRKEVVQSAREVLCMCTGRDEASEAPEELYKLAVICDAGDSVATEAARFLQLSLEHALNGPVRHSADLKHAALGCREEP